MDTCRLKSYVYPGVAHGRRFECHGCKGLKYAHLFIEQECKYHKCIAEIKTNG